MAKNKESVAVADLYRRNKKVIGDNPNLIKPGQRLTRADGSSYVVKKGDNLYKIIRSASKAKPKPKPKPASMQDSLGVDTNNYSGKKQDHGGVNGRVGKVNPPAIKGRPVRGRPGSGGVVRVRPPGAGANVNIVPRGQPSGAINTRPIDMTTGVTPKPKPRPVTAIRRAVRR